jgi:broad specificity phosphatase PhoE
VETKGAENFHHFGRDTTKMVNEVYDSGVQRGVLLMRHSARTFDRNIHDLLNPLTDHGRNLCRRFGAELPKSVRLRGYASPPERCMETAQIVIEAHQQKGGQATRTRPVEALSVFYALDQQKMWKGLSLADDLPSYLAQWFNNEVPADAMMPADLAVQMVLRALIGKLRDSGGEGVPGHLDLCVSHDMTLYTVRHGVGLEPLDGPPVEFLDGLLLFERNNKVFMRSQHGGEVALQV